MHEYHAPKRIITRTPAPQPGQLQAIKQLDRDLIVSAGAGSGKTWVLTERYIEMINNGSRPEQIVAITFTKKAAAEMKKRIRNAMQKMEQTSSSPEEAAYWHQAKQELERAVITTIHGFCTRLLKDAPLEAGVDPDFHVLDDTDAQLMERQVFSETVDEWLGQHESIARCLYRELGDRQAIYESALTLHEQMRVYHVDKETVLQETVTTLSERKERFEELKTELLHIVTSAQDLVANLSNAKNKQPQYLLDARHWLDKLASSLIKVNDWDGTYDKAVTSDFEVLLSSMWRNNGPDEMKQLHRTLKQQLGEWLSYVEAPSYRRLLSALLDLTNTAAEQYEVRKRREQALDFNDLEQLSLDMMRSHPHVAERWQSRLKYVMVDEFQDTNGLQKAILDELIGSDGNVKRFVVGDGKQSIYKFRGADVAVFNQTGAEIQLKGGEAVSLDVNFRTQQRLIAYVNSLFRFLMKKERGAPDYVIPYEPLTAFRKPVHALPAVELLAGTIDKNDDIDARTMEAERVARRIRRIVLNEEALVWEPSDKVTDEQPRAATYKDIALLLATRTHLHVYEQALKNQGIPYLVVGGRGFYDKQEIVDVLNVLRLIQNRDDELALLGFLRSPFVHLSDEALYWLTRDRRLMHAFFYLDVPPPEISAKQWAQLQRARGWFLQWERMKQTENVYGLVDHIIHETGYLAVLLAAPDGEQAVLNTYKLLEIARDIDRQGYSLFDFLERIDFLREEKMQETEAEWIQDRGNAVVLMTVHASKGLEFPIVVLPELARNVLNGGAGPRVLYAHREGMAVKLFRGRGEAEGDGLFDHFKQMEQGRELQEAYRLFYVAATRARDYLLLAGSQEEQKKPRDDLKNNWLDWIVKHLGAKQLSDLTDSVYAPEDSWSIKVTWDAQCITGDRFDRSDYSNEGEQVGYDRLQEMTGDTFADKVPDDKVISSLSSEQERLYPLYQPLTLEGGTGEESCSVSALMDYMTCPRLYVLKHRLRLPTESGSHTLLAEKRHVVLPATVFGNVLHRVMESIERETAVDTLIQNACHVEGIDASLHPDITDLVQPLIAHYSRSEWYKSSKKARSIRNELPFHYRMGTRTVSGVIDKLIEDEAGQVTIVDFKTNHIQSDDHLQRLTQTYTIQLQVYAVVVQELLGQRVKEAVCYFLRNDHPVKVAIDEQTLQREKQNWQQALDAMQHLSHSGPLPSCTDENCLCRQYLVTE